MRNDTPVACRQPGLERIVDADKDCTAEERNKPAQFYLCQLVVGKPGYGLYRWLTSTSYTSSAIRFDSNEVRLCSCTLALGLEVPSPAACLTTPEQHAAQQLPHR